MNSCWQVLRTYLGRLRFWIFGLAYVGVAMVALPPFWDAVGRSVDQARMIGLGLTLSVAMAAVVGCLAALHVRRLLSGPAAHVVPGFAAPHVLVGGLVCLMICVAVPWAQAWVTGLSPVRLIALHSLAGTLSAFVLFWPRTVFLAPAAALLLVWLAGTRPQVKSFFLQLFSGEFPVATAAAIVLAVLAYPAAALVLLRTRDRAATFSDDLVLDRTHEVTSRWKQPLLQLRDAAIEWRIGSAGRFAWQTRRWMIPCAASWSELGLLFALVIAVMTATGLASGDADGALVIAVVASFIALFMPLSAWRFRSTALAGEFTRPIAREPFVRQFMGAMLCDFAAWTAVASLITVTGYLPNIFSFRQAFPFILWRHLLSLWALAILLYGITIATIRLRYWLPVSLGLLVFLIMGAAYAVGWLFYWWVEVLKYPQFSGDVVFVLLMAVFTSFGLLLGALTYRRWLRMEFT